MNVTDVNGTYQNYSDQLIDNMGDVISKENVNESNVIVEKCVDNVVVKDVRCNDFPQAGLVKAQSTPEIPVSDGLSRRDANTGSSDPKAALEIDGSGDVTINSSKNHDGVCICNKYSVKSEMVEVEQFQLLQDLWSELHDIIQGLYDAKLNDLTPCTCCVDEDPQLMTKSEEQVLDYCAENIDQNGDWEDCSSCSACEATLKECGVKSDCGCFDLTGFPHHNLRELRNSKCIDARVIYLIEKLYKKSPHQLFEQLEDQIHIIATNLYKKLETVRKNHDKEQTLPELYIKLVLDCYEKLCSASKRVSPLLMQLQRGHLARFSLTWELLNKRLYLHCVHVKVQPHVLVYVSQFRAIQPDEKIYRELVQRYITLDEEMTLISAMWKDVSAMIDDYNNDQRELLERQAELDNRYQALLDIRNHQKQKLVNIYSDMKKVSQEFGDARTAEACRSRSNSVPNSTPTNISTESSTRDCEYSDTCHCCAPELCISEEVIRVLNKETDGSVDGTRITASSTSRGDIVCLPGGGGVTDNKPPNKKDTTKLAPSKKIDNSGALPNTDVKRKIIRLPDDFPCPCKVDCKHHGVENKEKIPIHSPTCKSGLNGITKPLNAAPSSETKAPCPKHGRRKLYTNEEWKSGSAKPPVHNNKAEALDGSKSHAHTQGHNCCNSDGGDPNHTHWTPSSHNKGCACCYCSVYEGTPPNTSSPVNRKYNEARERLRGKLNKTKAMNKATADIVQAPKLLVETESLDNKEHIRRIGLEKDSRDSSSCLSLEDPRNVNDLLDWIEGGLPRVKDPAKKAAKKARQKLKKLEEKEKETICEQMQENVRDQKQMYVVIPEPPKVKPSVNQAPTDGMVNIRLLPSDVPRVAVTAVGSSPDKNKLLYTLINGQKIIPEPENTKKKDKKKKKKQLQLIAEDIKPDVEVVKDLTCKVKLKKSTEEKTIQYSDNSKTNKTDEKLIKDNTKSNNKNSLRNNKDSKKSNDKSKIVVDKINKTIKVEKVPKCQDKFCQTDNKFNECAVLSEALNKLHISTDSRKTNKKGKSKNDDQQICNPSLMKNETTAVLKELTVNNGKSKKQKGVKNQNEATKNKTNEEKTSGSVKSNKSKVTEKTVKSTQKSENSTDNNTKDSTSNRKETSSEWIEINNKSRSNSNTKINTQTVMNVNNNKTIPTKSKKNKKSKENINQTSSGTMSNTLTSSFDKLQLNSDTTIEITKNNPVKTINMSMNTAVKKSSAKLNNIKPRCDLNVKPTSGCAEYSIMDQLNQGVGVERLKLPPGITLTRVDAATAYANQLRKCQQVSNKSSCTQNGMEAQKSAMIIANPVQYSALKDGETKSTMHSINTTGGSGTKSSRKSRRKNKNQETPTNSSKQSTSNNQPKMITLRNPLFQNNNLLKLNPNNIEEAPKQVPPVYNPIPMPKQASITQNKDGIFTIRSPALQHAMSSGITNFRPHPYAEIPENPEHFSYFSSSVPQKQDTNTGNIGESLYQNVTANNNASLFSNAEQIMKPNPYESSQDKLSTNMVNGDANTPAPKVAHYDGYNSFAKQNSAEFNNTDTKNDFITLTHDNMSFFSTPLPRKLNHPHEGVPSNTISRSGEEKQLSVSPTLHLRNYLNGQTVQRLNSQVTIHNISDPSYVAHQHEYRENGSSIEITKMPTSQVYGKFGNIGDELTVTRSKLSQNTEAYPLQIQHSVFNGQTAVKCKKDSEPVDNIFAPNQMVNLSELESEERDIESFKRFNYYFEPPKNKPKINLNVNDIVVRKKPSGNSDSGATCVNFNEYVPNVQQYQMNNCLQKKF